MFVRLCLLSVLGIGAIAMPAYSRDDETVGWGAGRDLPPAMEQHRGSNTPRGYRGSPPCGYIIPC